MRQIPAIRQTLEISQEEVQFWKSEIKASIKRQQDEFIKRVGYEELVRYFEALQVAEGMRINQVAIVDEFSPAILSIINSTINRIPSVSVKPKRPESSGMVNPMMMYQIQNPGFEPIKLTDLMEGALKYALPKIGFKEEFQLADFDLLVAGFSCIEINFKSEPQEFPMKDKLQSEESEKENPILDKMKDGILDAYNSVKNKILGKQEVEEKIAQEVSDGKGDMSDVTYLKRWNPLDILFDSKAITFKDSRFIAKKVRMSIAEFNIAYPQHKGKITATSEACKTIEYQGHNDPEHRKAVELYEIEIRKKSGRNCVLVIAEGLLEAVDYYEDPIITNGFKIKYKALDKYGKIYPISRAKKAKKPQDDINHYMTIQFEHVDRAMRKIAVYMQGLTAQGQAAQQSPDVYSIVEKNTPQAVYEAMPAPSVIPENKEVIILMKDSINKTFQTSELAKSGKSENEFATQDMLQNKTFEVNSSAVSDTLEDLANEVLDTLKDIILQVWDGEDYFHVTGSSGGESWYTPEMGALPDILLGDYLVQIDITSAQKPNPMKDRQEAIEYAQFITSPQILKFAMMHGKKPSMDVLNNVVKQFNQNPDLVFEDIAQTHAIPQGPVPINIPKNPEEQLGDENANIRAQM